MFRHISRPLLLLSALIVGLAGLAILVVALRPAPPALGGGNPGALPADTPVVFFPDTSTYVVVEIARTDAERQRGLMDRTSLDDGAGMLFVFPEPVEVAFWMKNTLIPLSIAFIDEQGIIIDIQDMQPQDETLHYPSGPYRYALEVPQGWFERAGVAIGHTAELPTEALSHQPSAIGDIISG